MRTTLIALVLLLLVFFTIWVIYRGLTAQNKWPGLLIGGPPQLLSSSQAGNSIVRTQGADNWSQVTVQQAGAASWLLVSEDDATAAGGALSNDGLSVGYRSANPNHAIVFIDLKSNQRTEISDSAIAAQGQKINVPGLTHCDWTTISWSPDGQRAAFLTCVDDKEPRSYVAIAEVEYPIQALTIMSETVFTSSAERTIHWLGNDTIVTDNPAAGGQSAGPVEYSVP